ncbi:MAG: hypothetical protein AAF525_07470 [Pseudomonadota bacterium]
MKTLWLTGHHLAADIYAFTADLEDPQVRHQLISAAHALSVSLRPNKTGVHRHGRTHIHQLCNGLTVLLATHQTTLTRHAMPTREWLHGIEAIRVLTDATRPSVHQDVEKSQPRHEMHAITLPVLHRGVTSTPAE